MPPPSQPLREAKEQVAKDGENGQAGDQTEEERLSEKERKRKAKRAEYMRFWRSVFECSLTSLNQDFGLAGSSNLQVLSCCLGFLILKLPWSRLDI